MSIALFGAGRDGMKALYEIGKEKIDCFIDNTRRGRLEGIPIKKLSDMNLSTVIYITSRRYRDEIVKQLLEAGFTGFFIYENGEAKQYKDINYLNRLTCTEWSNIYNKDMLDSVINRVKTDDVSIQSWEVLHLTNEGEHILEIGCGSGETSLFLSKHGRVVYSLDYSKAVIELVNMAQKATGFGGETYCLDASKSLPFREQQFDVVFQAGLLEHFQTEEQIELLGNWKKCCKRMLSLVPNAHSLAYRLGKYLAEKNKTWQYGLEIPQESLKEQFEKAGFVNVREYTIGDEHALNFLPKDHYLYIALKQWIVDMEESERKTCGQGYLLVTIGENNG